MQLKIFERQVCNESVSLDRENFPASMLWLGFNGKLNVTVPDDFKEGYGSVENADQHDRLTISDTGNVVKWFLHRNEVGVDWQLQDPEWSTHPDYLVFLGADKDEKWNTYLVRVSDKKVLQLSKGSVEETSTPHFWVGELKNDTLEEESSEFNEWNQGANVRGFIGSKSGKLAFNKKKNSRQTLYWIDFSKDSLVVNDVQKPLGKENYRAENPMISPDGNWMVFNFYEKQNDISTWLLPLSGNKEPVEVIPSGVDARWWKNSSGETYLVWAEIEGDYFVKSEFTSSSEEEAGLGRTLKRKINLGDALGPQHQYFSWGEDTEVLLNLPFKGGLSPNGYFLATGYSNAYLAKLP